MSTEISDVANEQKSVIVATSQQTRFHLGATRRSAEACAFTPPPSPPSIPDAASLTSSRSQVDIKDLNVSIVSSRTSSKAKKSKAGEAGSELEILTGAELRLKAGTVYGLLGRNGTGKSNECE